MPNYTIKIDVQGTKALLTEMPRLPEGVTKPIALRVTFDPSWDTVSPRRAVLWREGEALLEIELDAEGYAPVPSAFAASETPFYICIAGGTDRALSTNELCASFFDLHSAEAVEPRYTVHSGTYTLTQNGTYFSANTLLAQPVRVATAFNADTTSDTVTEQTLHAGITAHDAQGNPITGVYVNPFNADTTGDTVTEQTLHAGITAHDASGNAITGTYVNPFNADTTSDTVTEQTLHAGITAHDAQGNPITGTYVNPFNADTTSDTVTEQTLHAGITAHDAQGNAITGTYEPPKDTGIRTAAFTVTDCFTSEPQTFAQTVFALKQ